MTRIFRAFVGALIIGMTAFLLDPARIAALQYAQIDPGDKVTACVHDGGFGTVERVDSDIATVRLSDGSARRLHVDLLVER